MGRKRPPTHGLISKTAFDTSLPVERRTLASRLAARIRDEILRGALGPGEALRQEELAARLGVSHVPLREALRLLEVEGFVVNRPYRGVIVAPLSVEEIEELRDLRIALESQALRLSVPRLNAGDVDRMRGLVELRSRTEDPIRWSDLSREYYRTVYAPAGRPRLLSLILSLHTQSARYVARLVQSREALDAATRSVQTLVECCARGDAEGAVRQLELNYLGAAAGLVAGLAHGRARPRARGWSGGRAAAAASKGGAARGRRRGPGPR